MADDITERLRTIIATPHGVDIWTTTALEAADEIERLRREVLELHGVIRAHEGMYARAADEIERLRASRDRWREMALAYRLGTVEGDNLYEEMMGRG